jgi:hypothetical protein
MTEQRAREGRGGEPMSRSNADDAVSKALDHFQNRYFTLMKAASAVLAAYDADLDAAIEELRKARGPWTEFSDDPLITELRGQAGAAADADRPQWAELMLTAADRIEKR